MPDPWRIRIEGAPPVWRFPHERPQAASNGFSGITRHEIRLYRLGSLATISHDFPPFPAISQVPPPPHIRCPGAQRPPGHRLHGCIESLRKRPGLSVPPAGAAKYVRYSSPAVRHFSLERTSPPANGFHETRDTKHETRLFLLVLRPSCGEKCRLIPATIVKVA